MSNIVLFSKYGKKLDFDKYGPAKNGLRSNIYERVKGEEAKYTGLRVYHQTNPVVNTIREDHFYAVKDIKHEALPKLGQVYYDTNNRTPFNPVMAYTCEYIKQEIVDLDDEDVLVDKLISRVLSAGTVLAEHGYSLSTPHKGDIVIGEDGAYLIDPNKFIKEKNLTTEELIRINQLVALKYIKYGILNNIKAAVKENKELIIVRSIPTMEKTLEIVNKMSA